VYRCPLLPFWRLPPLSFLVLGMCRFKRTIPLVASMVPLFALRLSVEHKLPGPQYPPTPLPPTTPQRDETFSSPFPPHSSFFSLRVYGDDPIPSDTPCPSQKLDADLFSSENLIGTELPPVPRSLPSSLAVAGLPRSSRCSQRFIPKDTLPLLASPSPSPKFTPFFFFFSPEIDLSDQGFRVAR